MRYFITALAGVSLLLALGGCRHEQPDTPEAAMDATLAALETDTDFTLLAETADGTQYRFSRGSSTAETEYRSASTSKMVAAAVILALVEDGVLSLDDHPQDYLAFWPEQGSHGDIQLRHLLSFTSGLNVTPLCISNPFADFAGCVATVLERNPDIDAPGTGFYYASTHLQVAGLMAVRAAGVSGWGEVFDYFRARTGLFPSAAFDLPSGDNPRIAGGMHWRAEEYLGFLRALYQGEVLSPALLTQMTSDQLQGAPILYSPVADAPLELDWHYGFGLWIECAAVPFDCPETTRVSSAGAYGAYPFIDIERRYFGIVAREGSLATGHEGYQVWASVAQPMAEWAAAHQ